MQLIDVGEALMRVTDAPVSTMDSLTTKAYIYAAIKTLPNIEAEPVKHGRWTTSPTGYPFCTNCDWCPEEDDMTHGRYKYCPNCGALMENGDEYF